MTRRDESSSEMWVKSETILKTHQEVFELDRTLQGILNMFIVISFLIKDPKTFLCSP